MNEVRYTEIYTLFDSVYMKSKERCKKHAKQIYCHQNKKVVSSDSENRKRGMKELSGVMEIYLDFSGSYWAIINNKTA